MKVFANIVLYLFTKTKKTKNFKFILLIFFENDFFRFEGGWQSLKEDKFRVNLLESVFKKLFVFEGLWNVSIALGLTFGKIKKIKQITCSRSTIPVSVIPNCTGTIKIYSSVFNGAI